MTDLTFVPITSDDFKQKMHSLFKWNMDPLSAEEILRSGDALACPACGHFRYVMWKAVEPWGTLYTGKYCTCPTKGDDN